MRYSFVGNTGLRVSSLAFGTMSFGNEADEAESARLYARCREAGINLFDTANMYSQGRSESILGKLIADARDEIVLATKAVYPVSKDVNALGATRYHLVRAVEASLKRLGTDRIDLFYLHRYDERTDLEDTLYSLELLVRQGKILYPAVSNFSAWQTQRAVDLQAQRGYAKLACVQPMYNLLKRQAEVEILPMAHANGLGVFPYSPLAAGILTGKYASVQAPAAGRMLSNKQYQARYGSDVYTHVAERFLAIAGRVGVHPATLAVAWAAAHPGVTAPLLGARNVQQLEPSLAAADYELDRELYEELNTLYPPPSATDRTDDGTGADPWRARSATRRND
jgi:aryl-alcohol dehydrogenase-like predicted oxidoreductase